MSTDTNKLPTELLLAYINTFYGYGNWEKSKYWFVGIEEGGGNHLQNVMNRLNSWVDLGKTELIDCYDHHCKMGSFTEQSLKKLHTQTWTKLMIAKQNIIGREFNKEQLIKIQSEDWGRVDSENLLIELLPLPSPGLGNWSYAEQHWVDLDTDLKFLANRELYKAKVIPDRVKHIQQRIREHKPKLVLFYGSSMRQYWDQIIGADLEYRYIGKYKVGSVKIGETLFVQCPQPNYVRPYSFWIELGTTISELLQ